MFSIENLLSNKYSSKSSQNAVGRNRDQLDSIISATTPITSRKTSHNGSHRSSSGGMIEVNSFAGKRDTLYLELSTAAAFADIDAARPSTNSEDSLTDDNERKAVDIPRLTETPWHSKKLMPTVTMRDSGETEESQSVADTGLEGPQSKMTAVKVDGDGGGEKMIEGKSSGRKLKRRRSSDGGEGERESDSSSDKGTYYQAVCKTARQCMHGLKVLSLV